ncbi:MAG: hypothetical protein KJ995_06035, partial [Candidatus Omnitrophica bacterium]|nr:hypothetical protein [Candidatus Omnitrophota bacterium]
KEFADVVDKKTNIRERVGAINTAFTKLMDKTTGLAVDVRVDIGAGTLITANLDTGTVGMACGRVTVDNMKVDGVVDAGMVTAVKEFADVVDKKTNIRERVEVFSTVFSSLKDKVAGLRVDIGDGVTMTANLEAGTVSMMYADVTADNLWMVDGVVDAETVVAVKGIIDILNEKTNKAGVSRELFTIDRITLDIGADGDVTVNVPREAMEDFRNRKLKLLSGTDLSDINVLAGVLVEWYSYEETESGFELDAEGDGSTASRLRDGIAAIELEGRVNDLKKAVSQRVERIEGDKVAEIIMKKAIDRFSFLSKETAAEEGFEVREEQYKNLIRLQEFIRESSLSRLARLRDSITAESWLLPGEQVTATLGPPSLAEEVAMAMRKFFENKNLVDAARAPLAGLEIPDEVAKIKVESGTASVETSLGLDTILEYARYVKASLADMIKHGMKLSDNVHVYLVSARAVSNGAEGFKNIVNTFNGINERNARAGRKGRFLVVVVDESGDAADGTVRELIDGGKHRSSLRYSSLNKISDVLASAGEGKGVRVTGIASSKDKGDFISRMKRHCQTFVTAETFAEAMVLAITGAEFIEWEFTPQAITKYRDMLEEARRKGGKAGEIAVVSFSGAASEEAEDEINEALDAYSESEVAF